MFFGREDEITELRQIIRKSNLIVVYGKSGVGKTSLLKCGLGDKIDPSEGLMFEIRRTRTMNDSIKGVFQEFLKLSEVGDMKNNRPHSKDISAASQTDVLIHRPARRAVHHGERGRGKRNLLKLWFPSANWKFPARSFLFCAKNISERSLISRRRSRSFTTTPLGST